MRSLAISLGLTVLAAPAPAQQYVQRITHPSAWFRDPAGPCGSGFNLSNAVEIVFRP